MSTMLHTAVLISLSACVAHAQLEVDSVVRPGPGDKLPPAQTNEFAVEKSTHSSLAASRCGDEGLTTGKYCVCPTSLPMCYGSMCRSGRQVSSGRVVYGYKRGCSDCRCDHFDAIEREQEGRTGTSVRLSKWKHCATEGELCECEGLVRFGSKDQKLESVASGAINCSKKYLQAGGDTADEKTCDCKAGFPLGLLNTTFPGDWKHGRPRLLIFTVATHREPFIDLTEKSVDGLGDQFKLHVVGIGETFRGYGWKLKAVQKYLLAHQDQFDLVLFTDSFDSYIFSSADEIVEKFLAFKAPMLVSAEVNIWPNPHLAKYMPHNTGVYPYPNSGGYMGYLDYILDLYTNVIEIQAKSDCVDDQGELIKAVARNHSAFKIDHNAVIFQTLFGSAKQDLIIENSRPVNEKTGTRPCVLHANGWDKEPLLRILKQCDQLDSMLNNEVQAKKKTLEKTNTLQNREQGINNRCGFSNPNAGVAPDDISRFRNRLQKSQRALKARLEEANVNWYTIEQQIWEEQEYLGHCPIQDTIDSSSFILPDDAKDNGFRIFVYPMSETQEATLPAVYQEVRRVLKSSSYATRDPAEAAVFVPSVDTSCWCESCLGDRPLHAPAPESTAVSNALKGLDHWNGGRNHILFEFSDAPCLPYNAGQAIVAKVGLSKFHHREGHDVSMPLFAMVEWNSTSRRTPISERNFLLTFRGTRSPGSDQTRKHLWKIHNEDDGIFVACACRWFDADNSRSEGYDQRCKIDEQSFEKYTYTELMLGTKFSLVVEGFGYHSFRLTEVLAAGAIPVIAIDHYVLPYQSVLNWSSFSIRVPEHQLLEIPRILKDIPRERIAEMQMKVVQVYEEFFSSLRSQVLTAMEQIRIEHFVEDDDREHAIAQLNNNGIIPTSEQGTPQSVQTASMYCNAPQHRRKKARDGSVMR